MSDLIFKFLLKNQKQLGGKNDNKLYIVCKTSRKSILYFQRKFVLQNHFIIQDRSFVLERRVSMLIRQKMKTTIAFSYSEIRVKIFFSFLTSPDYSFFSFIFGSPRHHLFLPLLEFYFHPSTFFFFSFHIFYICMNCNNCIFFSFSVFL